MKALLLAAASLAAAPVLAAAAPYTQTTMHPGYAAPHPMYHPQPGGHPMMHNGGPMMMQPHMQQPRVYTTQRTYGAYNNPSVYRHPYNTNQTYYTSNRVDRDRDHDHDFRRDHDRDDHFRRGYVYFGLGGYPGYYGGYDGYYGGPGYDVGYDQGYYAPSAGYDYDDGDYGYAGQGYYDADQAYAQPDDGYADQGYAYQQSYTTGYYDQDQAAGPCGRWMWSAGQHQWVWTYCDCPSGYDEGSRW